MMSQLQSDLKQKSKCVLALMLSFSILTCSDVGNESGMFIELDPRLDVDQDGYFHLELLRNTWQTTHRISGFVTIDGEAAELVRVDWTSSHYWKLNDTLGHYIEYGYTDQLEYVALDTTFITGFDNFIVPTINCCSYSNADGEINTMLAPVRSMSGDTMTVGIQTSDEEPIGEIYIVLD
ncbi:MAG: hypothetical protein HOD11_03955 [Candidatus Marinimicrobia bacterium]|nr:hypothetical protein [Candidatus Neomarinimicrobiota bacterium]MBT5268534.1 hypothetical protein [Candidatus Neomarinimicrobiota bacterium]MBT6011147.1 hypothetical protein [Candidatus Neomarinimicrobiota bacterium]